MSIQFIQRIDHRTGDCVWEVADESYDMAQELARQVFEISSRFGDMILDQDRNDKYLAGLKSVIAEKKSKGEHVHVLDIGTGTGLLSLMASREGADRVTALEVFKPMAECAKRIIEKLGYSDKIRVIDSRSTDLSHLETKPNVIVAEVFDTELIGEGALRTFKEALINLVEPGCRVVPSTGRVFAVPVKSEFLAKFNRVPRLNKDEKDSPLGPCPGSAAVHDIQLSRVKKDDFTMLSEPVIAFNFNFEDAESIIYDECFDIEAECSTSGEVDAILMWWDLDMDGSGKDWIDMAPKWANPNYEWRDHWMQAVYYLPQKSVLKKGEKFTLKCAHDEYSLWFSTDEMPSPIDRPYCSCQLHNILMRSSIFRLNMLMDDLRMKEKISEICAGKSVVARGDGSLIGLLAAEYAEKVSIIETNHNFKQILHRYIQHYKYSSKVTIVSTTSELSEKPDIIVAEPFYLSATVPWENLRFWCDCDEIRRKFNDASIPAFPQSGRLIGLPMKFRHLQNIAKDVGCVNGFDLSIFDGISQKARQSTDRLIDEQPLWEYDGEATSSAIDLMSFNFDKSAEDEKAEKSINIPYGTNAIALWMDFTIGDHKISTGALDEKIVKGTEPNWNVAFKQGVFFLPTDLLSAKELNANIEFSAASCEICFGFKKNV